MNNSRKVNINQLINFAEFLSRYYVDAKPIHVSENDYQAVVLDDEVMGTNHEQSAFPR